VPECGPVNLREDTLSTRPKTHRRIAFSAVIAVAALLASCDSDEAAAPPPVATSSGSAASPTVPAPTSPALPAAPDGNNLAACQDADCAVVLRVGDQLTIDPAFGLDAMTVKSIGEDRITLAVLGSAGGLEAEGTDVSLSGSCTNGVCRDEGELSLTTGGPGRINDIRLTLAAVDRDRAVLVLRPQ